MAESIHVQNDVLVLSDLYHQIYMFDCFQLFHVLLANLLLVEMEKLKMSSHGRSSTFQM